MANKPKRIDISQALSPSGQDKAAEESQVTKAPKAVPVKKPPSGNSSVLSQTANQLEPVAEASQGARAKQLVDVGKTPVQNVAEDKLNAAKNKLNLDVAEDGLQKVNSAASKLNPRRSAPKLEGDAKVPSGIGGRFKQVLEKLKNPRVLLVAGGFLLMAVSGLAGYVIGLNDPRQSSHSEDLELPPISFESFASSATTTPSTNSVAPGVDLSTLPPYEFYDWPLQEAGRVSSCFGTRQVFGVSNFHKGLDIAVPEGSPVIASKTGIVERLRVRDDAMGYGTFVLLLHADGMRTLYAHLTPQLSLQEGQKINQGEVFARSGNTGRSTGPHLHFEVISSDALSINPAQFLESRLTAPMYSGLDESCWYRDLLAFQR